jgi:hypothetical protein
MTSAIDRIKKEKAQRMAKFQNLLGNAGLSELERFRDEVEHELELERKVRSELPKRDWGKR